MKKFSIAIFIAAFLAVSSPVFAQDHFDLRNYAKDGKTAKNYVTGVRNQRNFGICWSYASYAAMESNILMKGLSNGKMHNFSEWHMGNYGTKRTTASYHKNNVGNWGANWAHAVDYVANGHGIHHETSAPLPTKVGKNNSYLEYKPALHMKNKANYFIRSVVSIDKYNYANKESEYISKVKNMIKTHGAVYTYYRTASTGDDSSKYYRNVSRVDGKSAVIKKIHCYQESDKTKVKPANHAVAIVGWAKNVTFTGFDGKQRTRDCWIIKNSWGNNHTTTNGYHYIAMDATSAVGEAVAYNMERGNKYKNVVTNGIPTQLKHVVWHDGVIEPERYYKESWATAKMKSNGQYIESVGLWANVTGKNVKVSIFASLDDMKQNKAAYSETFTSSSQEGFKVFDLKKKIKLNGEYYIAYRITEKDGRNILNEFKIKLYDDQINGKGLAKGSNLIVYRNADGTIAATEDLKDYKLNSGRKDSDGNIIWNKYDAAVGVVAYTTETPEPATMLILFGGASGILMRRKRKKVA